MGVAYYIVLEKEIPGVDMFVPGKALANAETRLDKLAKTSGVTPLGEFFSCDPEEMLEMLGGDDEVEDQQMDKLPAEEWFDANDGLKTVRSLRAHLTSNSKPRKDDAIVVSDLDWFEKILEAAAAKKIRWHLAIDI